MTPPKSRRFLDMAIDRLGDKYGDPMRIRRAMASVVVAQMMPSGVVKGGSALKIRYGNAMTRFTKDLDAARDTDVVSYIQAFRERLSAGWCGFAGRIVEREPPHPKDVPESYVMSPYDVKLDYCTKPWLTVQFELGHNELGDADEYDEVLSSDIADAFIELGFPRPAPVKLMALEYQLAQKLHAVTEPGGDRARDLVDLQIIANDSKLDFAKARRICERTFAYRRRHSWPPRMTGRDDWSGMYLDARGELPVLPEVAMAIDWVNSLIDRIATAT